MHNPFSNTQKGILSSDCLIAISERGESLLISSKFDFYKNKLFDGADLKDNISREEWKTIPVEPGVYKCKIFLKSARCNHPQDPEEFDFTVWIEDAVKIDIK